MLCHGFGEAGAPYIIGVMAGALYDNMEGKLSTNPSKKRRMGRKFISLLMITLISDNSSVPMSDIERDYYSFEYAMFMTISLELLGGILFCWCAFYVVKDKEDADNEFERGEIIKYNV